MHQFSTFWKVCWHLFDDWRLLRVEDCHDCDSKIFISLIQTHVIVLFLFRVYTFSKWFKFCLFFSLIFWEFVVLLQFVRFFCHFNLIMQAILTCLVNCNVEDIECSVLAKIWKSTGTGKARSLCMFKLIQLLIITWGLIMARQWNYMYHKYLAKVYLFIHCSCIRAHIMKRLKKGTHRCSEGH